MVKRCLVPVRIIERNGMSEYMVKSGNSFGIGLRIDSGQFQYFAEMELDEAFQDAMHSVHSELLRRIIVRKAIKLRPCHSMGFI